MFKSAKKIWQLVGNFQSNKLSDIDIDLVELIKQSLKINWKGIISDSIDEVFNKSENKKIVEIFSIMVWTTVFSILFFISYLTLTFAGVLNMLLNGR